MLLCWNTLWECCCLFAFPGMFEYGRAVYGLWTNRHAWICRLALGVATTLP